MAAMERWLNTRAALIAAWSFIAALILGGVAFSVFLLLPSGEASEVDRALATATVAPVTATRPAGRALISGTIEKVEGQTLVVRLTTPESVRVVLRRNAPVGRLADGSIADVRGGEHVAANLSQQNDGRVIVTRITVQPPEIPIFGRGSDPPRPGTNISTPTLVTGTIVSNEGGKLRIMASTGERSADLAPAVRVSRFVPMSLAEVTSGRRIAVDGEYLVDGSLAASAIVIFGGP